MRLPWSPQSVAVGASAAAASDAGAGEKSSLTTSADDTAVDISGSLSGAVLKFNPIWHRMAETVTDKVRAAQRPFCTISRRARITSTQSMACLVLPQRRWRDIH